jgi:hypothetical protein
MMTRKTNVLGILLLAIAWSVFPSFPGATVNAEQTDAGQWKVLFDGSGFDGWAQTGPGYFELNRKDKTIISRGGMGLLWYYYDKFKDFTLRYEWKPERSEDNSGVFIRFPNIPNNKVQTDAKGRLVIGPWAAVHEGYEIQLCDSCGAKHRTGCVYTFQDVTEMPTNGPGQWNTMDITVIGQKYTVKINGKTVCEYTGNRALEGYIGFQNHSDNDVVHFRNIRIKEEK